MANVTAVPNILTDPGFVFWAPLATAEPTNTVTGGIFTDAWPVTWINLGATQDGSEFSYATKVSPILVAEFLDPIRQVPTERVGHMAFMLASWVAANLKLAMNGAVTTITGTTGTTLTKLVPPTPGSEVRSMIGWESTDATVRIVAFQCFNDVDIKIQFKKAPSISTIPTQFDFEIPQGGQPFAIYTAGTARA